MSDSTQKLGEKLLCSGVLNPEQIRNILIYQKAHPDILFGQVALLMGYLTEAELNKYL